MWSATSILFIFALFGGFWHVSSGRSYSLRPETISSKTVTLFLMKLATAYNAQTGLSNFFEDSFNATDCNNKTIQKDEFLKNLLEYRKEDPHYPVNIIVAAQVMKDDFWTITYIIKSKETSAETEFVLNTHDFKLITAKSLNC